MRNLYRPKVVLPTLTVGPGARKAAKHVADRSLNPGAPLDFPPHWNEPDVRGALLAMHGHVCAFCISELTRGDRGDVEHFRPKSLYFWLAYTFENYLLSCSRCNRIFKRDHFPLAPSELRVEYATRDHVVREGRLLCDPAVDPVEDWLTIEEGDLLFWKPAEGVLPGSIEHARVVATEAWFRLNKDPDLVKGRTDAIDQALCALASGNLDEARRQASRFRPHGGAIRSVLRGIDAFELPTITEELSWLLEDLWEEWEWARRIGGELCEGKLEQLRWAFAVLWRAPPPGADLNIASWLADAGIQAEVEPRYRELSNKESLS